MAETELKQETATDFFDLSRFEREEFKDLFERISAAESYLSKNCHKFDILKMQEAQNPVKLDSQLIEWPSINSHGELEWWVTEAYAGKFDFQKHYGHRAHLRGRNPFPEGAVLCIDTNHLFDFDRLDRHPYLFLKSFMVYGQIRGAHEAKRHVPGFQPYFIELGALSYNDVGNSWTFGVYGKGFKETNRAEE